MRRHLVVTGVVYAALHAGGCGGDSSSNGKADTSDTASDTSQPDGVGDTGVQPDTGDGPVAIASFTSDYATITRGPDAAGDLIEGTVTLSWATSHADAISIEVDGVPIAMTGCTPTISGDEGCVGGGTLKVKPAQATTFVLHATGKDGACDGTCPSAEVSVALAPPAIVYLETPEPVVAAGSTVGVAYDIQFAATWSVGLSVLGDDAERLFVPCDPAPDRTGDSACLVPVGDNGMALSIGELSIPNIQRDTVAAAIATNGADDGLGDVVLGDVLVPIRVPVEIRSFTVTPARVLPGGSVVLAWDVAGAQSVEVSTPSAAAVGLSTCVGLGEDGKGFCTVDLDADAHLGTIVFTLVAIQDTGSSSQARTVIEVIGGPAVAAFDASPAVVVPGQPTTLSWTAYGADAVALTANADILGADDCDTIGADGTGECEIIVPEGADAGGITLTLTASHHEVGPAATSDRLLTVLDAATVTAAELSDDTLLPGARVDLSWTTEHAASVVVSDDSMTIAQSDLAACSATDGTNGGGSCTLSLPLEMQPGTIHLSVVAVAPTGARSAPTTLDLTVGLAPEVSFTASPETLPEGGGDVALSWTAATAAHVTVVDDAAVPVTDVDTDAGSTCDGGLPCTPAGGIVTIAVVQSSTFTLTAWNDFGATVATASVALAGAPVITELDLGGNDVREHTVVVDDVSAELAWSVEDLGDGDEVRLERALLPTPNASCSTVQSWTIAGGFPKSGAVEGTIMVDGLTATAECFRFVAEDKDSTPTQRDTVVFKVMKTPAIDTFEADDITVQTGDTVSLTWATRAAYGVGLSVSPVGAVTSQDLAGCTAATGGCAVTIQPGTPLGDVHFSLVARGEESAHSDAETVDLTVGIGARLDAFTSTPTSSNKTTDVELTWASQDGASLTITDGAGTVVLSSTDAETIAAGTLDLKSVASTTTWALVVANEFGQATGSVTVFIGPSIDALTVNGGNALDGSESIVTGSATVAWTTTSAGGSQRLEVAPAPGNGNCATAGLTWTKVYDESPSPSPSASASLGTIIANQCVRLSVANTEAPPQSSTSTFLLREIPEIVSLDTTPNSISANGGTVIVTMGLRGTTALTLTAQYRDASGGVTGSRAVCTQGSLNNGTLTGGAGVDTVQCAHVIQACNLLCLNNGMPAGTKSVRYLLSVGDAEGDGASTTSAGGQDVTVP